MHTEFPDGADKHVVRWSPRRSVAGYAVLEEEPLETARCRDRQDAGDLRKDPVRVRHRARKRKCVAGHEPVRLFPDPDADLALEDDHLLILVGVHVQRKRRTVRLFGLPHAETTAAVGRGDVDDDSRAGKPQR